MTKELVAKDRVSMEVLAARQMLKGLKANKAPLGEAWISQSILIDKACPMYIKCL